MDKVKKIITSKAFIAFASGFIMYILVVLPELIAQNGILMYVGDYTMQSVPFTFHIRDSILNGNVIWDPSAGTGAQFLSSYAYYNLCSPFSLLYLIIPREWILYAITYVTALKYGTGSLLAYLYLKRFLKQGSFAVIGGVLYSLSSFSAYNMVFHFMDVIALFPLLLIGLEELCTKRRRGLFAIACALMAYVNYYFFFGQAVFIIIYYFARGTDKEFGISLKQFFSVAIEAIIGVMLSAPLLLPVAFTLMESAKATGTIASSDMLLYNDIFHYLKLIQSAIMVPDGFNFTSFFPEDDDMYPWGTLGSSVAAYLPLFSVAGVISYIITHRKKWDAILLTICGIMALVPVLNQAFSAFNSSYYARWFYMPMLIASMVSLKALEEKLSFKCGIAICSTGILALTAFQLLADTENLITSIASRGVIMIPLNYLHLAVSAIGIISLIIVIKMKRNNEFTQKFCVIAFVNIYLCYGIMSYYTLSFDDFDQYYIGYNSTEEALSSETTDRIMLCSRDIANYNLAFGAHSPAYFNSVYDNGHLRFLEENEQRFPSGTYRYISLETRELMDMLSVRFYYVPTGIDFDREMEYVYDYGAYSVYENPQSIPMGFTYDHIISHEDFSKLEKEDKYRVYAKYLVADDPSLFSDILDLYDGDLTLSDEEYAEQIALRKESSAEYTEYVSDGLVSKVDLDSEDLVFYSVSYNENWTATIDGETAEVYEVNNGLIGIRVPKGAHEIRLTYHVKGFAEGMIVFAAGAAALAAYIVLCRRKVK